ANTHDFILCFSNRGRVYWLKVFNVPRGQRASRGKPIVNLVPLADNEKITAILPVKDWNHGQFVFMATSKGTVKKTMLSDFSRPRADPHEREVDSRDESLDAGRDADQPRRGRKARRPGARRRARRRGRVVAMADDADRDAELARHREAIDALDAEILARLNARA